jgi:hypothetical protein
VCEAVKTLAAKTKNLASPAGFFAFVGSEIDLVLKPVGNGLPESISAVSAVILPSSCFQPVGTHFLAYFSALLSG